MSHAQSEVVDFFAVKKKVRAAPSAKRVKIEKPDDDIEPTITKLPQVSSTMKQKKTGKKQPGRPVVNKNVIRKIARETLTDFGKDPQDSTVQNQRDNPGQTKLSQSYKTPSKESTINETFKTPTKPSAQTNLLDKLATIAELDSPRSLLEHSRLKTPPKTPQLAHRRFEHLLEKYPSIQVPSSSKDGSVPIVLPESPRKVYERLGYLTSQECGVNLPKTYQLLSSMFSNAEGMISMTHGRNTAMTFEQLQKGIRETTKRNFEKSHLAQIKHVYPEAYNYKLIRKENPFGQRSRKDHYDFIIDPNLTTDLSTYSCPSPLKTPAQSPVKEEPLPRSPLKSPTKRTVVEVVADAPARKRLTGARQTARRRIFDTNLRKIVNDHHDKFLASLPNPCFLTEQEKGSIQRWHPQFNLDSVPDIAEAELPTPPAERKAATAQELLAKSKTELPAKVQEALRVAAEKNATIPDKKEAPVTKGVSASLLAKIKAKEQERQIKAMFSDPAAEARKKRIQRLPDFVRIIRNMYLMENSGSLPGEKVRKKLKDSYGQIDNVEMSKHLDLLQELLPQWIKVATIPGRGEFIKVQKKTPFADLDKKLKQAV